MARDPSNIDLSKSPPFDVGTEEPHAAIFKAKTFELIPKDGSSAGDPLNPLNLLPKLRARVGQAKLGCRLPLGLATT